MEGLPTDERTSDENTEVEEEKRMQFKWQIWLYVITSS